MENRNDHSNSHHHCNDYRPVHLAGDDTSEEIMRINEFPEHILIGIDPGTQTGLSAYDPDKQELIFVKSGSLIEMYHELMEWEEVVGRIRIEDARKRKWFGNRSKFKQQGAGSIKRDCKIWEEICQFHELPYEMVHPVRGGTKMNAEVFEKITGWEGQTNEHKRDSAMLVFGL